MATNTNVNFILYTLARITTIGLWLENAQGIDILIKRRCDNVQHMISPFSVKLSAKSFLVRWSRYKGSTCLKLRVGLRFASSKLIQFVSAWSRVVRYLLCVWATVNDVGLKQQWFGQLS